ncbi:MAG: OmpA family protein [Alphaproteobacteria bacterium]|nr:OmpA family protein [Alphaproteobacteria bacterium]
MPRLFLLAAIALGGCTAIQDQVNPTFLTPVAAPSQSVPAAAPAVARASAFPIFFTTGSATLDEAAQQGLAQAAEIARARPRVPILIIGYSEGEPAIARQRARAVIGELVQQGVPRARMRTILRNQTAMTDATVSHRVDVRVDEERVRRARP